MFNFDPKKVDYRKPLGSGSFGTVFPYREDKNDPKGDKWVVKLIETSSFKIDIVLMSFQEIVLGYGCKHPNILSLHSYHMGFNQETFAWSITIKLPRMEMSLDNYIKKMSTITQDQIIKTFHGIVSGLEYLHNENIAHRDIKPENILLDKENKVKLADFGVVTFIDGNTSKVVSNYAGTEEYKAPEVEALEPFENRGLYKADMWSVGIVMAKMCLGPNGRVTNKDKLTYFADKEGFFSQKLSELEGTYDKKLLDLIKSLIRKEPDSRVTAKQAREALESNYASVLSAEELSSKQGIVVSEKINIEKGLSPEVEVRSAPPEIRDPIILEKSNLEVQPKKLEHAKPVEYIPSEPNQEKDPKRFDDEEEEAKTEEPKSVSQVKRENSTNEELKEMKKYMERSLNQVFAFKIGKNPPKFVIESKDPSKVNIPTLTELAEQLKDYKEGNTFRNLQGISLSLLNCNESLSRGLKQVVSNISIECQSLIFLELNFWGSHNSIDDALIKDISIRIKYVTRLEHLVLFFNECNQITEQGVNHISNSIIPNLIKLKTFKLNLNSCNKISSESINQLGKKIKQSLPNLETLNLYLQECTDVADEAILELGAGLVSHKALGSLVLSLAHCTKISNNALLDLCKKIGQNLKALKLLQLVFDGLNVSNETKGLIKTALEGIPSATLDY